MEDNLSATEFDDWIAYWQISPWGETRADLRNGILCSLIYNKDLPKKYASKRKKPLDFMPYAPKPKDKPTDLKALRAYLDDLKAKGEARRKASNEQRDRQPPSPPLRLDG